DLVLALLEVVDLDEPALVRAAAQGGDEVLLRALDVRLRRLRELELAERLLELRPHALEPGARVGGDHRPDELQRQADGARPARRQARRRAEGVAVELLVDADGVFVQLGRDGIAAAAEVDEVEQRELRLKFFGRYAEALDQGGRGAPRSVVL